jgi:hypothetical protein
MEKMKQNKEEEMIRIVMPKTHAKRLALRNKMLNLLIAEVLDRHSIAGNLRLDYQNLARKIIKIIAEKGPPVWRKLIEIEKNRFVEYNNLKKDAVNEIVDMMLKIFEDALKEYGWMDIDVVDDILIRELEKRKLLKKAGVDYGGGEIRDLDTRETVA